MIWNYLYDKFKIDCKMYTIDCETTSAFLDEIKRLETNKEFLGGAVAAPYKEVIANYTKVKDRAVDKCGAANCIYRVKNEIASCNTDAIACVSELKKLVDMTLTQTILVLGFGGTGKAITAELLNSITNDSKINVCSRSKSESVVFDDNRIGMG